MPPTQIFLTPMNNISNYRISWAPSIFDTFSYTITTSPPTSSSELGDIITIQDSNEIRLDKINISISSCPSAVHSMFSIGKAMTTS